MQEKRIGLRSQRNREREREKATMKKKRVLTYIHEKVWLFVVVSAVLMLFFRYLLYVVGFLKRVDGYLHCRDNRSGVCVDEYYGAVSAIMSISLIPLSLSSGGVH